MDNKILKQNNICLKCHTLMDTDHRCVEEDIICPRFYTRQELEEQAKYREREVVYVRRVTSRPKTR